MKISDLITVKKITYLSIMTIVISLYLLVDSSVKMYRVQNFNQAVAAGDSSEVFSRSFESRFSIAYWLATKGMFKEATILFNNLVEEANTDQRSAIHYNIGNIFFNRGLIINGTSMTVRDEAEYLFRQAKKAYVQSLKLNNTHWDAKHNLDRLLTMLPGDPTPGVGDSDSPGLIMGNIPVGLP